MKFLHQTEGAEFGPQIGSSLIEGGGGLLGIETPLKDESQKVR
jgi:hypothetical protein